MTLGLARADHPSQVGSQDPKTALGFVRQLTDPGVFVFHDLRSELDEPVVVRHLKEFALSAAPGQTIVITGPDAGVPPSLEGVALPWTLEPPGRDEVEPLVRRTLDAPTQRGLVVALTDAHIGELVTVCLGLTLPEIERLIFRQALDDQKLDAAEVEGITAAKAELLADDGVLQLVPGLEDPDDVGPRNPQGMARAAGPRLRARRTQVRAGSASGGVDRGRPRLWELLVARCVARTWRKPLVLLDPGAIFTMYVGASEQRLRSALHTVEAMAPVVLWIDEIEKGFAGGTSDADAGTARRVLGEFLRWVQERPPGVFLIATCNDVTSLPPELVRRGRFDEVFFVDLPDATERQAILTLELRRRHRDPGAYDLAALATASAGMSGAELEGAVVGGMYRAFAAGRDLVTDDLAGELAQTTPLSRTRAESVIGLRA